MQHAKVGKSVSAHIRTNYEGIYFALLYDRFTGHYNIGVQVYVYEASGRIKYDRLRYAVRVYCFPGHIPRSRCGTCEIVKASIVCGVSTTR